MAVDTTKKKQEEWTPLGAGSDYYANKVDMSAEDQALLKSYGDAYNNATTDEERRAAHDAAEQLRANYGYKGGTDGSQYIVQPPKATTSTGSTGSFDYAPAPTYTDNYSARIDEMLNNILNRDAFSYNAATDPLYAQYKEQYTREGQRAMKDTLGQVSARTGGLASSYAVSAAQQQNNYYMQQLNDKIPELYQMAYQMYLDNMDMDVQKYGLLEGASDRQYNRYRDTMSDWRGDRDFAYGVYRDDVGDGQWQMNYDRGVFESDRDYDRGVLESDRDYDHTVGRETIEDGRYANETAYDRALELLSGGVMPDASMLSAAGLTSAQANTILSNAAKAAKGSGGGDDDKKTPDDGDIEPDWGNVIDLGLGMINARTVVSLKEAGYIVEDDKGKLAWAPGWDLNKYRQEQERQKEQMNGLQFIQNQEDGTKIIDSYPMVNPLDPGGYVQNVDEVLDKFLKKYS